MEKVTTNSDFNISGRYVYKSYADGSIDVIYETLNADGVPNHLSLVMNLNRQEASILADFILGAEHKLGTTVN